MTERLVLTSRSVVAGGYPAALVRRSAGRRGAWYRDYIETQINATSATSPGPLARRVAPTARRGRESYGHVQRGGPAAFRIDAPDDPDYVTLLGVFLLIACPRGTRTTRLACCLLPRHRCGLRPA
jgi:hypothetical protein